MFYEFYTLLLIGIVVSGEEKCNRISSQKGQMSEIESTDCGRRTINDFNTVKETQALNGVKYSGCHDLELFWRCHTFCNTPSKYPFKLNNVHCHCNDETVKKNGKRFQMVKCQCNLLNGHARSTEIMSVKRMLCVFERRCLNRSFMQQLCRKKLGTHVSQEHNIGDEHTVELGDD